MVRDRIIVEGSVPTTKQPPVEEFVVSSENLLKRVKELVHEGNVRRIQIKDNNGHPLIEIPLSVGVIGALLVPVWAAVGAIAVFAANFTVVVTREEEK